MPDPLDLDDDDRAELAAVVREAIARDRYFMSPRVKRLRAISTGWSHRHHDHSPNPPLKPSAEPSLLYRKLRGGGRRRR